MRRVKKLVLYAVATLVVLAPSLHAAKQPTLALDDLVERSDAIVVGSVKSIDESAGGNPRFPLTAVKLDVARVLRGQLSNPKTFTITFRGGVTPQGMRQRWTNVPALAVGDEYVLFLRAQYYVSPLIPAQKSILRAVRVQGRRIAVDADGRVIRASARHGLLHGDKVSEPILQRKQGGEPQRHIAPQPPSVVAQQGRMAAAGSDFDEVLELIFRASSRTKRDTRPIPDLLSPLSLPGEAPPATPGVDEPGRPSDQ